MMHYNSEYIKNYMLHYDIGVPTTVIVAIFLFVCGFIILFYRFRISYSLFVRQASLCLFCGYFFFVLCTTIFFREETFEKRYFLCPFWSYTVLYEKLLVQIILNVLMFIPIGFFVGGLFEKKNVLNVIFIGFLLSFFIELTQLITTRGVFNVDDIIHNVLGCFIGFSFFMLCYKIIRKLSLCLSQRNNDILHQ